MANWEHELNEFSRKWRREHQVEESEPSPVEPESPDAPPPLSREELREKLLKNRTKKEKS